MHFAPAHPLVTHVPWQVVVPLEARLLARLLLLPQLVLGWVDRSIAEPHVSQPKSIDQGGIIQDDDE